MSGPRLIAACLLIALGPVCAAAKNWPGWRGPHSDGVSRETQAPLNWSPTSGVRWSVELPGAGISNPIVWEERVWVTWSDGLDQSELHVMCLDAATGGQRWHRRLWGTSPTLCHGTKSTMASPSPVTDGQFVYAFFGTGDVFCLDERGALVWQRSLAQEYGPFENRFAAASSPVLFGDSLFLQCDHYGASYLLSVDRRTGANRWKADRPDCWLSWSSPVIVQGRGPDAYELVVAGSEKLTGYDPATGTSLWTLAGLARECVPTPIGAAGRVYATSGPGGGSYCIKTGGQGELSDEQIVWQNDQGAPFVPSAILVGGLFYLVDDKGILTCLDAETGETAWRRRLGGAFTASPVAAAGRVYFTDEEGRTTVIAAGERSYRELARNSLAEPVYASPAISGGGAIYSDQRPVVVHRRGVSSVPRAIRHWLFKSEPDDFSIQDLAKAPDQTTCWDGVRNYQARNFLRDDIRRGDRVLFYHSSTKPQAIVGTAVVVRDGYPDHTAWQPKHEHFDPKASAENPIWQMVDIRLEEVFDRALTLDCLKKEKSLAGMELLRRGSRLSIQPVTNAEFQTVLRLARARLDDGTTRRGTTR